MKRNSGWLIIIIRTIFFMKLLQFIVIGCSSGSIIGGTVGWTFYQIYAGIAKTLPDTMSSMNFN